jgi:hypothetical protein
MLAVGTFEFLHLTNSVPRVSAVSAAGGLGVYWDAGCTKPVSSIDWGVLSPGQTEKITVYARNEGDQPLLLNVTPTNYSPANASRYLNFTWTCVDIEIVPNKTVLVTQSLHVSPAAGGISNFGFDIVFGGKAYILGDINGDGRVDILDATLLANAFNSRLGATNWNPKCDLNGDGVVNILDAIIMSNNWTG